MHIFNFIKFILVIIKGYEKINLNIFMEYFSKYFEFSPIFRMENTIQFVNFNEFYEFFD